eukprot:gene5426-39114_t
MPPDKHQNGVEFPPFRRINAWKDSSIGSVISFEDKTSDGGKGGVVLPEQYVARIHHELRALADAAG